MASKSKKRSKRRSSANPLDRIRRNLERGDYKQALKDARVCFRRAPTPEHRNVLEHAYAGRAQQLVQQSLRDDARRILQELLDLGVTEPSVEAGLADLLLAAGMLDRLPEDHAALAGEERDRLAIKAADQAVLRPKDAPKGMPEIRDGALKVRAALEAVERGDEATAMSHLQEFSRHSPFAEWKYFVRGLIAYYGRDKAGMLANWDRLDADRTASRIASPLRAMAGVAPLQQDGRVRAQVGRLEKRVADQAVLGHLIKIRQFAVDHNWPQVFKTLRTARGELRKLEKGIYRRLVAWLCGVLVHDGLVDELERLTRCVDPLPIDPCWNRARALVRERSKAAGHFDTERYWREYLSDLPKASGLSPAERNLVGGMVWVHLAEHHVEGTLSLRVCPCGQDHGPAIDLAEERALDAYEQCLTLVPTYLPAYEGLASFHMLSDRPDAAAQTWRRLLKHVPDNLEALLFLGKHYVGGHEPLKAREFAERARQQKPLDKEVAELLWSTYVGAASHFAREEQYQRAREELAAADQLQPARRDDYDVLARKAVLEAKAGCVNAARQFVERGQESLAEPTAFWLAMTIEAIRCELPSQEAWLYEKRWVDALKRRCRTKTAGLMCRMMADHLKTQQAYPNRDNHVQHLMKYVRRCSRVKWQPEDLRNVCIFLDELEEQGDELLEKYAQRGMRKFPKIAVFHYYSGTAEMNKGPMYCDSQMATQHFQEAIRLGSTSNDPRDKEVVTQAKQGLGLVQGLLWHLDDEDDFDDDDYDDDDYYEDYYEDDDEMDSGGTAGLSSGGVVNMIRDICNRMGLDPDMVLDDLARRQTDRL